MTNQLLLNGCAPEPLIHYLKALGIFRLVTKQFDAQARGCWLGDVFALETEKTAEELLEFFLNEYRPTPIVAPWNNSSGFYPGDKSQRALLESLSRLSTERVAGYSDTIDAAREIVGARQKAPEKEEKAGMLSQARCSFPDAAVEWLDAAYVLGDEKPGYPPLLGWGGNDGRLDFTTNFIARLLEVFPHAIQQQTTEQLKSAPADKRAKLEKRLLKQAEEQSAESVRQLRAAFFMNCPATLANVAVGQFHPGGVGGANATQGVTGDSLVNPWDFILAIEGALLLASAAVRKLAPGARSMASFPFTTRNSTVGYGTATGNEKMRAEIWLPIWERAAGFAEIAYLFGEGRVRFNSKARQEVRTGFDFARAVAELGADRGIAAFQRYGFLERNGQANLAAPLGRFEVCERPRAALVHQLDRWLEATRRACGKKETPPRLIRARAEVEEAIFSLCAHGQPEQLRDALVALGAAESEIAVTPRFRDDNYLRPLSGLSTSWAWECWDGSAEFEIAAALAAIRGEGKRGAFRSHLEPVEARDKSAYFEWTKDDTGVVWQAGTLEDNLAAVLQRRSIDARTVSASHPQLQSSHTASLRSINDFLSRATDDDKLEALLRGLSLINWTPRNGAGSGSDRVDALITTPEPEANPGATAHGTAPKAVVPKLPPTLPRAYALLKLLFLPNGKLEADSQPIHHEPAVVPLLRAGRVSEALAITERRLRSTGLTPFTAQLYFPDEEGTRLAAALLIPIDEPVVRVLAAAVLRPAQSD
ncbi:MAG: type I-U CRISPR-associated protein Csx17 [Blastocatellia bacterium]